MTKEEQTDVSQLYQDVQDAAEALNAAEAKYSAVHSDKIHRLNRYNEATKALDRALAVARKNAPQDTDWGRQRRDDRHPPGGA